MEIARLRETRLLLHAPRMPRSSLILGESFVDFWQDVDPRNLHLQQSRRPPCIIESLYFLVDTSFAEAHPSLQPMPSLLVSTPQGSVQPTLQQAPYFESNIHPGPDLFLGGTFGRNLGPTYCYSHQGRSVDRPARHSTDRGRKTILTGQCGHDPPRQSCGTLHHAQSDRARHGR